MVVYLLRSVQCNAISCKYQFDIVNMASYHLATLSSFHHVVNLSTWPMLTSVKFELSAISWKHLTNSTIFFEKFEFLYQEELLSCEINIGTFYDFPFWRERELSIQSEVGGGEANRRRGDKHQKLDANSGDRILISIKFSTAWSLGQVWI